MALKMAISSSIHFRFFGIESQSEPSQKRVQKLQRGVISPNGLAFSAPIPIRDTLSEVVDPMLKNA